MRGIFARQVEGLPGPAQDQVERLLLEGVEAVHQAAAVDLAVELVEAAQQLPAIAQRGSASTARFMLLRAWPPTSNGA